MSNRKEALGRLRAVDPHLDCQWDDDLQVPRRVRGSLSPAMKGDALSVAKTFLKSNAGILDLKDPDRELELVNVRVDRAGTTHIRLRQIWNGIPVFASAVVLHVAPDNSVRGLNGLFHPDIDAEAKAKLTAEEAEKAAVGHAGKSEKIPGVMPRLEVFRHEKKYRLCWHVTIDGMDEEKRPAQWEYFVDAKNGEIVHRYNNLHLHPGMSGFGRGRYCGCVSLRTYHDSTLNTYQLRDTSRPGIEIRTYDMAGSTNRDVLNLSADQNNRWNDTNRNPRSASQEPETDAHYYAGMVVDYFLNVHGRNSWDDAGGAVETCVHYGNNLTGSFWDPTRSRVYHPDGDGVTIDYKSSLDVIAHEFTHGVTQTSAGLIYAGESGAINESYSDFFACMIQKDWVFEEHMYLGATAPNDALRSMRDPTLYGQPDHYSNLGVGVHTNSGIPNKAAYLATHGGTHHGIEVFGLGREVTERIWYEAYSYLTPNSNFADFRQALEDACDDLYPNDAWKLAVIRNAMAAVGIGNAVGYPLCPNFSVETPCWLKHDVVACTWKPETCTVSQVIDPCLLKADTDPCYYVLETDPCKLVIETGPCRFTDETGGCCSRELIIEPGPGCAREGFVDPQPGPCCNRELILEPGLEVCKMGDIPFFNPEGCPGETVIIGRLVGGGRVQPLGVKRGTGGQPLKHVRVLTRKRRR